MTGWQGTYCVRWCLSVYVVVEILCLVVQPMKRLSGYLKGKAGQPSPVGCVDIPTGDLW
jgi:hypothetical protein